MFVYLMYLFLTNNQLSEVYLYSVHQSEKNM